MKDNEGVSSEIMAISVGIFSDLFWKIHAFYGENTREINEMTKYTDNWHEATFDYIRHHGYKLEEQKLYYLEFPVTNLSQINRFVNLEKAENSVFIDSKLETESFKTRFTEEEIDKHEILSQYKQFMKEVD